MTVAELIQKLQSLHADPNTPINFLVNGLDEAEFETAVVHEYTRTMPDGSWKNGQEIEFYLQSDDLKD